MAASSPFADTTNGIDGNRPTGPNAQRVEPAGQGARQGAMSRLIIRLASVLLALLLAACSGASPATTPPSVQVRTGGDAVAAVIATEPRLEGIQAFDSRIIGQSSWYTVEQASGVGAYVVAIRIGWGDCEAGCIDEHTWLYAVVPDGTVNLQSQAGPPVPQDAWPSPEAPGRTGLAVTAVAGPVCPVETDPPDPDCAPRAVGNATVVIRDAAGAEVARGVTGPDGSFIVELAPGDYTLEPMPVEGLMGTAPSVTTSVDAGVLTTVELEYDTGIR